MTKSGISADVFAPLRLRRSSLPTAKSCWSRTIAATARRRSRRSFRRSASYRSEAPRAPSLRAWKVFAQAGGEIVACIDGDCVAEPFWLAELTRPLQNPAISAVGGITIFHGNWFVWLGSYVIFYLANGQARSLLSIFIPKLHYPVFWGTSFACRRLDYQRVGGFASLLDLRARLALPEWAEDFYLSLKLWQIGAIVFTRRPVAHAASKQSSGRESILRAWSQQRSERLLLKEIMTG
jgi:hypothetical protein